MRHTSVAPDDIGPVIPIFFGVAGGRPATSTIVTLIVPVRPPYVAVTVTVWFDVAVAAVRTPPVPIVAYEELTLHVGLIAAVVPLSHVPVAV
jgi:glycerol-3-phosphate acyltransferase PlsY